MIIRKRKNQASDWACIPDDELLNNCIHCGLCLPTCPTYSLTNSEKSSPRGRIRLIKAVMEGDLLPTKNFVYEMNFCLACLACETACPAGIKYGSLIEAARMYIYTRLYPHNLLYSFSRLIIGWIFSKQQRLRRLASVIRSFQNSILFQKIFSVFSRLFSAHLYDIWKLMPPIDRKYPDMLVEGGGTFKNPKYQVIFLTGCIMDIAFAGVNEDTVRLLTNHNCEVIIPKGQVCCGALQFHNGDYERAKELSKHNIDLFSLYNYDYIITNSAGCGSFMKKYFEIFMHDNSLAEKSRLFSERVMDITEFLFKTSFPDINLQENNNFYAKRITYHDACHLVHAQGISEQPRRLIQNIKGIEYVELPESAWCCGSAGIYNITHHKDSMEILKRKIDNIRTIRPDVILSGNPGCLIQLNYGLKKENMNIELMHTATFLRKAYDL